jgi:hypothetical protein
VETTINKPLSGKEVREAILFDIRTALENDDRLSGHLAYDSFSFKALFTVSLPSAVMTEFQREVSGVRGNPLETVESVELEAERPIQAPNDVRYETEQPIPILSTDEKGNTVEKQVSYVGKTRDGRPKGHKSVPESPPSVERVKRNVVKGIDGQA